MERDPEKHSLAPDELQGIYEARVAPRLFANAQPVERPTAVVLGGQPGSGKTPMQKAAEREFSGQGGLAKIIGDDLRSYLPHYKGLQRADDQTAAFYTDRDSGRLVEKAIADAAQRGVNVMVEGTMRNAETVAATLQQFREAGYTTDARALAVSPEMSALGIMQRYAAQKEARGVGRMTAPEAHQNALRGMLDTLDRIQDNRLADSLTIYRRGGEAIQRFDLSRTPEADEPRARALVEQERNRPFTPQEAAFIQREVERITPILHKHGIIAERDTNLLLEQIQVLQGRGSGPAQLGPFLSLDDLKREHGNVAQLAVKQAEKGLADAPESEREQAARNLALTKDIANPDNFQRKLDEARTNQIPVRDMQGMQPLQRLATIGAAVDRELQRQRDTGRGETDRQAGRSDPVRSSADKSSREDERER